MDRDLLRRLGAEKPVEIVTFSAQPSESVSKPSATTAVKKAVSYGKSRPPPPVSHSSTSSAFP